jgi:NAD(P)-dependent dehydrogenase (short-subunit alcohol dehydrogenase family)
MPVAASAKPAEHRTLFDSARNHFGGIDIVVANAGIDETGGPILDVTEKDYDPMYGVNAKGAFFTLQHGARTVNDGGTILYISSSSTIQPHAGFGLYGSRKLPGPTSSESSPKRSAPAGSPSMPRFRPQPTARTTSPATTIHTRSDLWFRTGALWGPEWDPSTTSQTQSSSPTNLPAGSAGNNCSSVAAHRPKARSTRKTPGPKRDLRASFVGSMLSVFRCLSCVLPPLPGAASCAASCADLAMCTLAVINRERFARRRRCPVAVIRTRAPAGASHAEIRRLTRAGR